MFELFAVYKVCNTTPLLYRTHRWLTYYTFVSNVCNVSTELMLINTVQLFNYDSVKKYCVDFFTHKSSSVIFTNLNLTLAYNAKVRERIYFSYKYAVVTQLTNSQSIVYYGLQKQLKLATHISAPVVSLVSTQIFSNTLLAKRIKIGNNVALLDLDSSMELNLEYAEVHKSNLLSVLYTSETIAQRTYPQVINYGGENTYYSLNGLFNLFRYRHTSLMSTNYSILINNTHINMYDKDSNCVESHKAGFKKITVDIDFLKDIDGLWCNRYNLNYIFYEDCIDIFYKGKIYRYNFDSLVFSTTNYFALDYNLQPDQALMYYDKNYAMPYICCNSAENSQLLTEPAEFWNFIQVNNIKELQDYQSAQDASYIHEAFYPTDFYISSIICRHKDTFIAQAYKGNTYKTIVSFLINSSNTVVDEIFSYNGSDILFNAYPLLYYSKLKSKFTSGAVFGSIAKLDISKLDIEEFSIEHTECLIEGCASDIWIMYRAINELYYIFREDSFDKRINLSVIFNLLDQRILDIKVFTSNTLYILTQNRLVYELNYINMQKRLISLIGIPIALIKFNDNIGTVMTRLGTNLMFESLQPIDWTTNPDNWITPMDMKKGQILYPYLLHTGIMHKCCSPITTLTNFNVVERTSMHSIEKEIGIVSKFTNYSELETLASVRVGSCSQQVYGEINRDSLTAYVYQKSATAYAKSLTVTKNLNTDGTFTLNIDDLSFPESLERGYKVYAK